MYLNITMLIKILLKIDLRSHLISSKVYWTQQSIKKKYNTQSNKTRYAVKHNVLFVHLFLYDLHTASGRYDNVKTSKFNKTLHNDHQIQLYRIVGRKIKYCDETHLKSSADDGSVPSGRSNSETCEDVTAQYRRNLLLCYSEQMLG